MTKSKGSLLSPEEQALCEKVSGSGKSLHSQRAQALLAVNEGVTQVNAAELSGLTMGQVRYCIQRFRQIRAALFETQGESKDTNRLTESESEIEDSTKPLKKPGDKKKKDKKKTKKKGKKKDQKGKDKKGKDKKNKKDKDKKKGKKKDKNKDNKRKVKSDKKSKKDKKVKAKKSRKNKKSKNAKKKEAASTAKKKSGKSKK